jgi:glucose/arabinose dehydrogenase
MATRALKITGIVTIVLVILGLVGWLLRDEIVRQFFRPTESTVQEGQQSGWSDVETVANGLETPWSLAFLPDGDMLVTERSGQMKRIGTQGKTYRIEGVRETSEGGLLGVALHSDFQNNGWLYLYSTTEQGGELTNRVERYMLMGNMLHERTTILENIPAASNHNGGGIAFGPDKKLYITTGDAALGEPAQDTGSLAGKILRMNDDGSVPSDNPFGNLTWSYGHRNPQGITWDEQGRLWSVEHGPSGDQGKGGGKDELNLIEKGANYGWPVVAGSETRAGMHSPVAQSGNDETWAPSGITYHGGSLFFAGLRGQTLYEAKIQGNTVELSRHFTEQYGRLRAVTARGDQLYFTSSNRDGRGNPLAGDDKIYRFSF